MKTHRDLIYWQYAKIISDSAGMGKKRIRMILFSRWGLNQRQHRDRDSGFHIGLSMLLFGLRVYGNPIIMLIVMVLGTASFVGVGIIMTAVTDQ